MKPGTYKARAIEAALGFTLEGSPQIAIAFVVIGGEHDAEQVQWFGYFTEKSERRTFESLRICGWKGDDLSDLTGIGDEEVSIVVEEDTYQGVTRTKVAWVNRPGGIAMRTRMTPEEAKRFAKQMMGAAVASRGGAAPLAKTNGAPRQRQQLAAAAGAVAPIDEDDIPY